MQKRKLLFLLILMLGVVYYLYLPDYKVYNSINFSNGGNVENTEATLDVVVYQYWGIEELSERIKDEHIMINGTPAKLEINLYYSEWHLKKVKPFKSIIYK